LDWETQSRHYDTLKEQPLPELRASLGLPANAAILLTISRVTDLCRYDWLIEAAGAINTQGRPLTIVMIGDGPALPALKAQAEQLGVDLRCTGALYDEAVIAAHVMASDVVVSPGKVGLTAMHALAYGTPIVSHSDLDRQMPEIEAVIEGQSGALFPFGSVSGLAEAISSVLASSSSPARRREACRAALIGRFTPQDQRRLIDDAVDRMLAR
ncbi:MAG TPA: glycosyltransferase, partial [Novosphingobium sp.]|nr:glycosyltransferase [Novosphingobium sp.]